jgi:hypothetical protein
VTRPRPPWTLPLTCLLALLYGLAFENAYVGYINPVYEYGHYYYFPPTLGLWVACYAFIVAPCLLMRWTDATSSYGIALFYTLCYVPTQLIMLFNWNRDAGELLLVQASLAGSMAVFMAFASAGWRPVAEPVPIKRLAPIMAVLMAISMALLIWTYRDYMRFVGFADVYDLRFETNEIDAGPLVDYLVSWLSYCFLPFYLARGILNKRMRDVALAIVAALLIYSSTGAKAMILMPPIMLFMYGLMRAGRHFLPAVLAVMTAALFFVTELLPDDGIGFWVKFIFLLRTLCAGGWANFVYYEYFPQHGYTYYSHIGAVNKLTDAYPYGQYSLGQTIGLEYSGSELANYNANFWASDGFAALGLVGIPVITVVALFVFFAINRISSRYSSRFVALWLSGFWLGLLNLPLTTALVSAGGALTLLLLWFAARRTPKAAGLPSPPAAAASP